MYGVRLEACSGRTAEKGWLSKRGGSHHTWQQANEFSGAGVCTGCCLDIFDGK